MLARSLVLMTAGVRLHCCDFTSRKHHLDADTLSCCLLREPSVDEFSAPQRISDSIAVLHSGDVTAEQRADPTLMLVIKC